MMIVSIKVPVGTLIRNQPRNRRDDHGVSVGPQSRPRFVQYIVDNFRQESLQHLIAYTELDGDGSMFLVDGHNRADACEQKCGPSYLVQIELHENLSQAEREQLVLDIAHVSTYTTSDQFPAALIVGEPWAIAISELFASYGLDVPNKVEGALKSVFDVRGELILKQTVSTCISAWGDIGLKGNSQPFKGLAVFIERYPHHNPRHLVAALKRDYTNMQALKTAANHLPGDPMTRTTAMVLYTYNKGRRNGNILGA
jgi:hypothetical protein